MLRYAMRPGGLMCLLGFLLLAFSFFGADTASAQTPAPNWSPTFPRDGANVHTDVACKGERCVAVGVSGQIAVTTDGGFNWRTVASPVGSSSVYTQYPPYTDDLYTLDCPTALVCYAGGTSGQLIKSVDGGETWNSQQNSAISNTVRTLSCPNAQECYAGGNSNFLLRTTNGGANWINVANVPTTTNSTLVCPASNTCFAGSVFIGVVNPPSLLYKTVDGGMNWTIIGEDKVNKILDCLDENICFASGSFTNDSTYRTTDGGASWTRILDISVAKMDCFSSDVCYAYSTGSSQSNSAKFIYNTKNGGTTWQIDSTYLNFILQDIACLDATRCIAVGGSQQGYVGAFQSPTIVGTVDGGKYWTKRNESIVKPLQSVSCPTQQICYTVGARGTILKTTDNSFSWYEQSAPLTTTLFGISCPSATFCVAVGDLGKIRYTTDGTNWNTAPAFNSNPLYSVSCPTTNECTAVGSNGFILRMNGTPNSWLQENSGVNLMLFSVSCPTSGTCYTTGENGTLLKKSGGMWIPQTSGSMLDLRSISCPALTTCYITEAYSTTPSYTGIGSGGRIISTTNGTNWTASQALSYASFASITCPNITTCFVGSSSRIISTTDSGATWTYKEFISDSGQQALSISCISATQCIAVGTNNLISQTYEDASQGTLWKGRYNFFGYYFFDGTCTVGSAVCVAAGIEGYGGSILTSRDNGATWRTTLFPEINSFQNVSCPASQVCYVIGSKFSSSGPSSVLLKTTNSGTNWQVVTTTQIIKNSIECLTADLCLGLDKDCGFSVFTCYGGRDVWRSTDGGINWVKTGTDYYAELDCPSAQVCYAIGNSGSPTATKYIRKSTNAGLTWELLTAPVITPAITGLSCPTEQVCYILSRPVSETGANAEYQVLKTTNGGTDWQTVTIPQLLILSRFSLIACATPSHCLVGGALGLFAATRDGGNTWESVPQRTSPPLYLSMECQPDRTCRVFGEGGVILQGKLAACSLTVSKTVDDGTCGTLRAAVESALTGENIIFDLGVTTPTLQLSSNLTVPSGVNLVAANCASPKVTVQGTNNPTLKLSGSSRLEGWLFNGVRLQATSGGTMPNLLNCVQFKR